MTRPLSLGEQIAEAPSVADVHALLAKGRDFQFASRRTRNRWEHVAKERISKLQSKNGSAK